MADSLRKVEQDIIGCELCPRLREYCREIARVKRRAYRDWDYWGRPVPGWGDPNARVLIIGLAPAAHGANRTGRVFTGDSSGNFLYKVMYETGFASQPTSVRRDDGLTLHDAWITAAAHCAPPDNKPTPAEVLACRPYLERELKLLKDLKVIVALGRLAFDNYVRLRGLRHLDFGHDRQHDTSPILVTSYHPSQQNTSTGKLTEAMLLAVFARVRRLIANPAESAGPGS